MMKIKSRLEFVLWEWLASKFMGSFINYNYIYISFTCMSAPDVPGQCKATLFDHSKQHDVVNAFLHLF